MRERRRIGRLVFTAGACPLDGQGNTVAIGNYAEQAAPSDLQPSNRIT
jgi:hypothetical protein